MANPRHPDDSAPLDFDLDLDQIGPDDAEAAPPSDAGGVPRRPVRRDELDELEASGDTGTDGEPERPAAPGKDQAAFPDESVEVVFDDDEEEGYLDEDPDGGSEPPPIAGNPGGTASPLPELPELDAVTTPMEVKPRGFSPRNSARRIEAILPDLEDAEDLEPLDDLEPLEIPQASADLPAAPAPPEAVDPQPRDAPVPPEATALPDDLEPLDESLPVSPPAPLDALAPPSTAAVTADPLDDPDSLDELEGPDDLDDLEGLEYQTVEPVSPPATAAGVPAPAPGPASPSASAMAADNPDVSGADNTPGGKSPPSRGLVPLEWASLAMVAVLVLAALVLFQRSVRRDPSASAAGKPSATVPDRIDGTLFKLEGVKAYWRDRRDTDRVDRNSIILPEISLEITGGASGFLQALFQDETGALRGDSVTRRATNGTFEAGGTESKFLGTEGFINESLFAGYQMEGADAAWSVTLRESADNSQWTELATFRIPAVRENP